MITSPNVTTLPIALLQIIKRKIFLCVFITYIHNQLSYWPHILWYMTFLPVSSSRFERILRKYSCLVKKRKLRESVNIHPLSSYSPSLNSEYGLQVTGSERLYTVLPPTIVSCISILSLKITTSASLPEVRLPLF